jgi:hypothetical protein
MLAVQAVLRVRLWTSHAAGIFLRRAGDRRLPTR